MRFHPKYNLKYDLKPICHYINLCFVVFFTAPFILYILTIIAVFYNFLNENLKINYLFSLLGIDKHHKDILKLIEFFVSDLNIIFPYYFVVFISFLYPVFTILIPIYLIYWLFSTTKYILLKVIKERNGN